MVLISRLIAALAYAGAAFLLGLALGERGELGVVQHAFTATIPIASVVIAVFSKRNRAHVLATGAALFLGLFLGQRQFERAFDECRSSGHIVREALVRFHGQHGGYPARLEELEIDLPCRAGLRPTILRYLSNERGFRLWITNEREVVRFDSRPSS